MVGPESIPGSGTSGTRSSFPVLPDPESFPARGIPGGGFLGKGWIPGKRLLGGRGDVGKEGIQGKWDAGGRWETGKMGCTENGMQEKWDAG